MTGLAPRQAQILAFIRSYKQRRGFMPSYGEIQSAMGAKSKSAAARIVDCLVARGALRKSFRRARSLELTDEALCPHCSHPLGSENCRRAAGAPPGLGSP